MACETHCREIEVTAVSILQSLSKCCRRDRKTNLIVTRKQFFPRGFWFLPFSKSSDRCETTCLSILGRNEQQIYLHKSWLKETFGLVPTHVCYIYIYIYYKMGDYTAVRNNGGTCANKPNEDNVCICITYCKKHCVRSLGERSIRFSVTVNCFGLKANQSYCCTCFCFMVRSKAIRESVREGNDIAVFFIIQQLTQLIFM